MGAGPTPDSLADEIRELEQGRADAAESERPALDAELEAKKARAEVLRTRLEAAAEAEDDADEGAPT